MGFVFGSRAVPADVEAAGSEDDDADDHNHEDYDTIVRTINTKTTYRTHRGD